MKSRLDHAYVLFLSFSSRLQMHVRTCRGNTRKHGREERHLLNVSLVKQAVGATMMFVWIPGVLSSEFTGKSHVGSSMAGTSQDSVMHQGQQGGAAGNTGLGPTRDSAQTRRPCPGLHAASLSNEEQIALCSELLPERGESPRRPVSARLYEELAEAEVKETQRLPQDSSFPTAPRPCCCSRSRLRAAATRPAAEFFTLRFN